jgi:hypothetical protein
VGYARGKKYNYDIAPGETHGDWRVLKDLGNEDDSIIGRRNEKLECQCLLCNRVFVITKRMMLDTGKGCCKYCSSRKSNKYKIEEDYWIGYSTKGDPFIVNFDIFLYYGLQKHCWFVAKDGYFKATYRDETGKKLYIKQSNAVWEHYNGELEEGYVIDHINGVVYDNRIENLRKLTVQENACNKKLHNKNKSGVSGVHYITSEDAWCAKIGYKSKVYNLGWFKNFEDAVIARLTAEKEYFGDLSRQKHLFEKYGI